MHQTLKTHQPHTTPHKTNKQIQQSSGVQNQHAEITAHFYTVTVDNLKEEIKKAILFIIAWKRIKYFEINLKREKVFFPKNKALLNKIKEDSNTWNDALCSWTGRPHAVKTPILPPKPSSESKQSLGFFFLHKF